MLWDLLSQRVQHAEGDVWWDPCLGRTIGDVDVETVELRGWGEGAGEVEEPDSGGFEVRRRR